MPAPALRVFLSHRYKSPDVNLALFDLCAEHATIAFDVDAPNGATNVTRLQRMIRASDAFLGMFPLAWDRSDPPTRADLSAKSAYFRLELGLAARSRKPILLFADRRLGGVLDVPESAALVEFEPGDLAGGRVSTHRARFAAELKRFVTRVKAVIAYEATRSVPWRANTVGLLLPAIDAYSSSVVDRLHAILRGAGNSPEPIAWPQSITPGFTRAIDACDWIVTDIGRHADTDSVPAFLEAWGVPVLRLRHVAAPAESAMTPAEIALYGAYEVGYVRDIVRWSSAEDLFEPFEQRLQRIHQETRRISTISDARQYFRSAAPRSEPVFISYRGVDAEAVKPILDAFSHRFQRVFDYKDGESIRPGRPWLPEIFDSLDRSALAVLLISDAYLASEHCVHEAERAVEQRNDRKLAVLPVKLGGVKAVTLPNYLSRFQAVTYTGDAARLVEHALALLND